MINLYDHADGGGTCGHCNACKWWQHNPDGSAGHDDVGLCMHEELVHFELEVSGDSACNRFRAAEIPVSQSH